MKKGTEGDCIKVTLLNFLFVVKYTSRKRRLFGDNQRVEKLLVSIWKFWDD